MLCEEKYEKPWPEFHLEVRVAATGRSVLPLEVGGLVYFSSYYSILFQNMSMAFELTGLLPGTTYKIAVQANFFLAQVSN